MQMKCSPEDHLNKVAVKIRCTEASSELSSVRKGMLRLQDLQVEGVREIPNVFTEKPERPRSKTTDKNIMKPEIRGSR